MLYPSDSFTQSVVQLSASIDKIRFLTGYFPSTNCLSSLLPYVIGTQSIRSLINHPLCVSFIQIVVRIFVLVSMSFSFPYLSSLFTFLLTLTFFHLLGKVC